MNARKALNEPTFGEKVHPILDSLEDAFLDHAAMFPGELAGYTQDDFRSALCIFFDVASEMMWRYQERMGMPFPVREKAVQQFANELHTVIYNHCDIDTRKLFKK